MSVKCVFIGDSGVGKTSLLMAYTNDEVPQDDIPSVLDTIIVKEEHSSVSIDVTLFDTSGKDSEDPLRPTCYPDADVFFLCFAIDSPDSFEHIKTKWYPEIKDHLSNHSTVVLVGTKSDARKDAQKDVSIVSKEQGESLANEIGHVDYIECSAKNHQGLKEVFAPAKEYISELPSMKSKEACLLL